MVHAESVNKVSKSEAFAGPRTPPAQYGPSRTLAFSYSRIPESIGRWGRVSLLTGILQVVREHIAQSVRPPGQL